MKNTSLIKKTALTATVAISLVAIAHSNPEGALKPRCDGPPKERALKEMRELNLTEQQREQIRTLMQQSRETLRPRMDALAAERKKLREIMDTDPVNPGAITAQTQRVAQLEAELNVARAQERAKVEAVLTPEQRAKWREMREQRREKAEEKMRERIRERWQKRGKEKPEA